MKITFFLNQFPEPSETFVINQIIGLIKLGNEVNIIATRKGNIAQCHQSVIDYSLIEKTTYLTSELTQDSAINIRAKRILNTIKPLNIKNKLKALNINRFGLHSQSLLLPSIVTRNSKVFEADIFVAHFGTAGVVANKLRELNLLKGKLVTIFHGSDISVHSILKIFKDDYKKLFMTGELMVPISDLWRSRLEELGCPENKIKVNRMGIDSKQFKCRSFDKPLSKKLKIITVARFTEKKGLTYALDAMAILQNQGIEFEYNIIGGGELKSDIENKIAKLALKNVKLLGFQPQNKVSDLLNESDVFLLPSITAKSGDMEGIPVSLMEAMAMGLIAVSTYHSGIPELITDSKSGFLVPERNAEEIAKVALKIVNDEINIEEIRKEAKERIDASFEQTKLYKEFIGILEKVNEQ
ncbi:glycosyltransferase [Pseudoalteromonas sp. A3]|uniref:glycosyltransferase n=1 Tax=Pseudoalteromonas sp. A3 TaxID=142792 RepID=UPI0022200FB6|nr:glycosyltransferase [Pseudoalteromonas sp. A3]MCW1718707.1 glycosyltransferase [Pseudoalteromonas sp. A3]